MADLQSQLDRIARRRKLAEAMAGNAMRPIDPNRSSGRYVTPISPFEGLAQVASAALAGRSMSKLDMEEEGARTSAQERMAKALSMAAGIGGAAPAASLTQPPAPPKQYPNTPIAAPEATVLPPAAAAAEGDLLASQIRQPAQNVPLETPPVEVSGNRAPAKPPLPTAQAYMAQLVKVSQDNNVPLQELLANPVVVENLKQINELNKPRELSEGAMVTSPQYGEIASNPKLTEAERLEQGVTRAENSGNMGLVETLNTQLRGLGISNVGQDKATGRLYGMKGGQAIYLDDGTPFQGRPELPTGMQYGEDGKPTQVPGYADMRADIAKAGKPEQNITVDARSFDKTEGAERAKLSVARQEGAMKAQDFAGSVRLLADVLEGYGGGPLTTFQAGVGRVFPESEYGKIASIDDLVNSVRTKLATQVRATGSGATSDYEMKQYMAAIPSLATTPQGRQMMAQVAERIAERELVASDVYGELANKGQVKLAEWRKAVREQVGDLFTKEELAIMKGQPAKDTGGYTIKKVK